MNTVTLKPKAVLGPVEAMAFRVTSKQAIRNGVSGAIVDLTNVRELSLAGLAAVTHLLAEGRRIGLGHFA